MKLLLPVLAVFLLMAGCKKDDVAPVNNLPSIVKGTVKGKVVAANKKTAVRNATVFIADSAKIYHTNTDIYGNFLLEAPVGAKVLQIQSGSGSIFRTQLNVTIEANKTVEASPTAITLNQVAALAYLPGNYDKIESIIIDSLGYTATMIDLGALHSVNNLSYFNAVFINCNLNMTTDWLQDSALASYVANGGSLYVSDWAVAVLIGNNGPNCPLPRQGGFIADSNLCTQRIGQVGMLNNASIISSSLQAYLNKNQMDIKFNLGNWESVMNYRPAFWEVMVRHPFTQAPLLMRTSSFTNSSAGSVNIGNSSTTSMVTICHKPQGSTPVTITIPAADLAMHLAHGDSKGSCSSVNGAGRIYYTTFHNHPNGLISPDMKNILEYMILNL